MKRLASCAGRALLVPEHLDVGEAALEVDGANTPFSPSDLPPPGAGGDWPPTQRGHGGYLACHRVRPTRTGRTEQPLTEVVPVARRRVVALTIDREVEANLWLLQNYFPADQDRRRSSNAPVRWDTG